MSRRLRSSAPVRFEKLRSGTLRKLFVPSARELASWFPQHADSMDAALAMHLQRVGFDPATGRMAHPDALPDEVIHGCGGASCSPAAELAAEA